MGRAVIGLVALPYGYATWILGLRWAVRLGAHRGPEILAAVRQGQAAASSLRSGLTPRKI